MSQVIWKLRQDHRNMARLLELLEREIEAHEEGAVPDYFLIESILNYVLNFPDFCHHPLEDLVLAKLRQRDPAAAEVIGDLEAEHTKLAANTRRFAAAVRAIQDDHQLPRQWFAAVAAEFRDGLSRHMQMEEVLFFPPALRALSTADWKEIELQSTSAKDPLFDGKVDRAFRELHHDIVEWGRLAANSA